MADGVHVIAAAADRNRRTLAADAHEGGEGGRIDRTEPSFVRATIALEEPGPLVARNFHDGAPSLTVGWRPNIEVPRARSREEDCAVRLRVARTDADAS